MTREKTIEELFIMLNAIRLVEIEEALDDDAKHSCMTAKAALTSAINLLVMGCWENAELSIPKDEEEVLVCSLSKNGRRNIDKGYYSKELKRFVHRGKAEITHWMPLPKLPEEG